MHTYFDSAIISQLAYSNLQLYSTKRVSSFCGSEKSIDDRIIIMLCGQCSNCNGAAAESLN